MRSVQNLCGYIFNHLGGTGPSSEQVTFILMEFKEVLLLSFLLCLVCGDSIVSCFKESEDSPLIRTESGCNSLEYELWLFCLKLFLGYIISVMDFQK